jgi:hypothetical protein
MGQLEAALFDSQGLVDKVPFIEYIPSGDGLYQTPPNYEARNPSWYGTFAYITPVII